MSHKRKPNSRRPDVVRAVPEGPLTRGLAERERLRLLQRPLLEKLQPLSAAFNEVDAHLTVLGSSVGLHIELVHLLQDARGWMINGVDRAISVGDPHNVDEARLLLELEFLLLDFAATPAHLAEWATVDEWRRPQKFGFGQLRQREERRRGLDLDMVIPARESWTSHSAADHPWPLKEVEPPSRHWTFSLLNSLVDLLWHAGGVTVAAERAVTGIGCEIPDTYWSLSTDAYEEASERAHQALNSHIPEAEFAALWEPRPKSQRRHKYWQLSTAVGTDSQMVQPPTAS